MLEKMKVLSFVPESRAIKILQGLRGVWGDRYDKVTYLREKLDINYEGNGQAVYVAAEEFLPLIPFIKVAVPTESYLLVTLKNNAQYKLAYIDVEFDIPDTSLDELIIQNIKGIEVLKKTTLQNLIRPDMRCIYVDSRGAISCNFQQGTVTRKITSTKPVLLPPDLIDYIDDNMQVYLSGEMLIAVSSNKVIFSPVADIVEEEEPWFESIYNQAVVAQEECAAGNFSFTGIDSSFADSLKRLSNFGKKVVFYNNRMTVGESFEPISIQSILEDAYDIEIVNSVISFAKEILFMEGVMVLRNEDTIILVSAEEEI